MKFGIWKTASLLQSISEDVPSNVTSFSLVLMKDMRGILPRIGFGETFELELSMVIESEKSSQCIHFHLKNALREIPH